VNEIELQAIRVSETPLQFLDLKFFNICIGKPRKIIAKELIIASNPSVICDSLKKIDQGLEIYYNNKFVKSNNHE